LYLWRYHGGYPAIIEDHPVIDDVSELELTGPTHTFGHGSLVVECWPEARVCLGNPEGSVGPCDHCRRYLGTTVPAIGTGTLNLRYTPGLQLDPAWRPPGVNQDIVAEVSAGTEVQLFDFRTEADGYTWIRAAVDGQHYGWIAEQFIATTADRETTGSLDALGLCDAGDSLIFGGQGHADSDYEEDFEVAFCATGTALYYVGVDLNNGLSIRLDVCVDVPGRRWLALDGNVSYIVDTRGTAPSSSLHVSTSEGQQLISGTFSGIYAGSGPGSIEAEETTC